MLVRRRLRSAFAGLVAFLVFGAFDHWPFWGDTWFFVGLGVFLSATFVEPFFSRPQDAIVNAVGGLGAYLSVDRGSIESLWTAFLAVMLVLAAAGMYASLAVEGRAKLVAFRVSSSLGRAVVVGAGALLLIVLSEAASGEEGFEWLAAGSVALVVATGVEWDRMISGLRRTDRLATAVAAIGPKMLLVAVGGGESYAQGESLTIEGQSLARGIVLARLPHKEGMRYRIGLDREVSEVVARYPGEVRLRSCDDDRVILGVAAEGSSDSRLEFEPLGDLSVGMPVSLNVKGEPLLYQVSQLELVSSTWIGASAVVRRARAHVVGWPWDEEEIDEAEHGIALEAFEGALTALGEDRYERSEFIWCFRRLGRFRDPHALSALPHIVTRMPGLTGEAMIDASRTPPTKASATRLSERGDCRHHAMVQRLASLAERTTECCDVVGVSGELDTSPDKDVVGELQVHVGKRP